METKFYGDGALINEAILDDKKSGSRLSNKDGAEKSCAASPIDEMLRQVPEGGTKLFERSCMDNGEERFFSVHQNFDYPGGVEWHNTLGLKNNPWFGSRWTDRIPVSSVPTPDVSFELSAGKLVDFYSTGNHAFFLSERLVRLIEGIDPGSLEYRPVTIVASKGVKVPFFIAMPNRNLSTIDTQRTDVFVKDKNYGGQWLRSIKFPNGVSFRNQDLAGISSFTDFDLTRWFWSRELIEAAKAEGIRGLETMSARLITRLPVDRL